MFQYLLDRFDNYNLFVFIDNLFQPLPIWQQMIDELEVKRSDMIDQPMIVNNSYDLFNKREKLPGYDWDQCEFSPLSCLLRRRKRQITVDSIERQ
jgi:hypothetical protein